MGLIQTRESTRPAVHDVDELCCIFGLSPQTVRSELSNGGIPGGFKCGRRWYLSDANLRRFMDGEVS